MEHARSLRLFATGMLQRFWIWTPALALDPYDVWEKLVKPSLPDAWQLDLPWSPSWAPAVLFGLLALAAFLTFHAHVGQANHPPRPDMRFADVVARAIGSRDFWERKNPDRMMPVFQVIREKARLGHLAVWGREHHPNDILQSGMPLKLIPSDYWDDYQFDYLEFLRSESGGAEAACGGVSGQGFVDFWFDGGQVAREIKAVGLIERIKRRFEK